MPPLPHRYFIGALSVGGPSIWPAVCFTSVSKTTTMYVAAQRNTKHGCKKASPSGCWHFFVGNRRLVECAIGARIESAIPPEKKKETALQVLVRRLFLNNSTLNL